MCGIAGYLNFNGEPASAVTLEKMARAIAHRGPDGEGVYVDRQCGLSHRRLSIIDLSPAGHQPMASADDRFILTYNGEIYNFQELRVELESKGYIFHSRTDSEVVLNALVEWGTNALKKFNGMFAIALWDKKTEKLLLARDRYGVKPLYILETNAQLIFGSEVKSLIEHPAAGSELCEEGLLEYLTFQNFLDQKTLFKNIRMFPTGTFMEIDSKHKIVEKKFWEFNFREPKKPLVEKEYVENVKFLVQQAVSRQLVSDVSIGCYLSGGIDSGTISAFASKQIENLNTFTVGFDLTSASGIEIGFDERKLAELMSYKFGTEQYEMVLKAGDMERCIKNLVWSLEEPRVGQSYPNFYASKLASRFSKVVLSGTGGDEIFGGYSWRYSKHAINDTVEDYVNKYYSYWHRLASVDEINSLTSPLRKYQSYSSTKEIFRSILNPPKNEQPSPFDYVNNSLTFEASTFLHGLLCVEDKLAMAQSLEVRVPFLDNDLVDFVSQVPVKYKIDERSMNNSASQFHTNKNKLILRKALGEVVPREIIEAEKKGFSAPDETWFRGESVDFVCDTLLNTNSQISNFLDQKVIISLVNQHLSGRANKRLLLWSLIYLEIWCNTFLKSRMA